MAVVTDRELLDTIHDTPWIAELLTLFDFDVARASDGPVSLLGGQPLEAIAGDGTGGTFLLVGADAAVRPVLYVGSEGEGGLIAISLRSALALIVGVASLHDATAYPVDEDGGRALRDFLTSADDEIRADRPELDDNRDRLRTALGLPPVDDALLRSLQSVAADFDYRPITGEGDRYRPMLSWLETAGESEGPAAPRVPPSAPIPTARPEEVPGQQALF